MHRSTSTSCLVVLLCGLGSTTRAAEVHELEDLLRRVDVGVVQDDEVVALLREERDVSHLSAALRVVLADAWRPPRRAATALAALVVVDPAGAQGDLVRALTHPRSEVRVAALALLADAAPREPVGPARAGLLDVLARGPRREAALAIEALGGWGEPRTCLLPLLEAVERDPTLTDVALAALARVVGFDAGDLRAWWRLWASSAPLWAEHEDLLAIVDAGDPTSVVAALEKLARLPDPRTIATIERRVRRLDAEVGWANVSAAQQGVAAARALGTLRDPRGEPALRVMLSERAPDALQAQARWALARLRDDARVTARGHDARALPATGATAPAPPAAASRREPRTDERLIVAFAWAIAAVALATAALAALARRRQRPPSLRSVRTSEAARIVGRALREIEVEPVKSLRLASESSRQAPRGPHAPDAAPEASDDVDVDVVHVVLGNAPRSKEPPRAPADPAWQSVVDGLDELGGNVGRVVARVGGGEERVVYEAGDDVPLADAMATLAGLRESVDDVRVELTRSRASMVVYSSRSGALPARSGPVASEAAGPSPDSRWSELVSALQELGSSISEVWAQVAGDPERRRWSVGSAGLASVLAALGELRPRVVQAGVRVFGGHAELVMFEGPPPPATAPADPVWGRLLEALRSMAGSVSGLSARLRCPPALTTLFPTPDVATLAEAIVTLEALEPVVAEVRVRLPGVASELVLLDRDARQGPAPDALAPAVTSADWLELVRAVEELSSEVEAVIVSGTDGETIVLRADDEGGPPELLASLQALEGMATRVRVRLARGGAELVLVDLPVAAASGAPAPPVRTTSLTWRNVLGSLEAMGEALDAISAKVVGADRRLLFGPGAPRSLAQALSELGGGPADFQDVKVRLKHSPSELTLFDRALAS